MHLERIRFLVSFAVLQILIDLVNIAAIKSVTITVEDRFTYETTAQFNTFGIERFDNVFGIGRYQSTFGMGEQSPINGTYFDVEVRPADEYGGATMGGGYPVARSNTFYALRLDKPADFFGLWVSDADDSNIVRFFHHDEKVFEYYVKNVLEGLGASRQVYVGHPFNNFVPHFLNVTEYLFINAFFTGGVVYDQVQFVQGNVGRFESDNHTVGNWTVTSGRHVITETLPTTTSTTTTTTSTTTTRTSTTTTTTSTTTTTTSTTTTTTSTTRPRRCWCRGYGCASICR